MKEAERTNCSICNDTGLFPFEKNGKVIANVFLFCECKEDKPYPYALKPEMFDFAMSYDFYRNLCGLHGWPDPGPEYPVKPVKVIEPVFRRRPVDKEIDQLKAQVKNLTNKMVKLSATKRKESEY